MTCIGIDPAYAKPVTLAYCGSKGWEIYEADPRAKAHWSFHESLSAKLMDAIEKGATRVCLEDGFIGVNPKVGMRLAEIRGVIKTVATMQGLECRLVAPSRWQSDCLTWAGVRPHKHAEIAATAILRAKHTTGMDLGEDMACAVCLAEWGDAHPEAWEDC